MIIDKLENLSLYQGVNAHISEVVSFVDAHDLKAFPAGRVELGNGAFADFDIAHGKHREEALLESHNRMLDIQLVMEEEEEMGWSPRSELPQAPYDEKRDISFYESEMPQQFFRLKPGYFVLFLPGDAHAPCICPAASYRKVIFKLPIAP